MAATKVFDAGPAACHRGVAGRSPQSAVCTGAARFSGPSGLWAAPTWSQRSFASAAPSIGLEIGRHLADLLVLVSRFQLSPVHRHLSPFVVVIHLLEPIVPTLEAACRCRRSVGLECGRQVAAGMS
jgi:hypothetical protein